MSKPPVKKHLLMQVRLDDDNRLAEAQDPRRPACIEFIGHRMAFFHVFPLVRDDRGKRERERDSN